MSSRENTTVTKKYFDVARTNLQMDCNSVNVLQFC